MGTLEEEIISGSSAYEGIIMGEMQLEEGLEWLIDAQNNVYNLLN